MACSVKPPALNAIVIYLLADWLVRKLEQRRGTALKQRQVVFFVIFLALALVSFAVLRRILGTG
jgi:predicted PurR-regulated permease PerM